MNRCCFMTNEPLTSLSTNFVNLQKVQYIDLFRWVKRNKITRDKCITFRDLIFLTKQIKTSYFNYFHNLFLDNKIKRFFSFESFLLWQYETKGTARVFFQFCGNQDTVEHLNTNWAWSAKVCYTNVSDGNSRLEKRMWNFKWLYTRIPSALHSCPHSNGGKIKTIKLRIFTTSRFTGFYHIRNLSKFARLNLPNCFWLLLHNLFTIVWILRNKTNNESYANYEWF